MKHDAESIICGVLSECNSDWPESVMQMSISELLEKARDKNPAKYEELQEVITSVLNQLVY